MKKLFTTLLAVLALAQPALSRADTPSPDALVKDVTTDVLNVVKNDKDIQNGNLKRTQQLIEAKVLPHFNFAHMTSYAMGRDWRQANADQQKVLTEEFKDLLVRTYSNAFTGYKNQSVTVKPSRVQPADTDATVRTLISQSGGQPLHIDYNLEKTPAGWKVYDVVVENSSLVTVYRQKFHEQVQSGGVDGLIKFLQQGNSSAVARK